MKRYLLLILVFHCYTSELLSQITNETQPSALGVNFAYNLFKNPISSDDQKYSSGVAGLAINYMKGFSRRWEYNISLSGLILDLVNKNNVELGNGNKQLLLELDGSIRYKLLTNEHTVKPYIQAGIGGSVYNEYWGLYFPAGIGFQINVTPSTFILVNSQKRFALTSSQDDHYYFSIGLAGNIGKKKAKKISHAVPPLVVTPPKDSDGDGVPDVEDACPLVTGVSKYKGCPIPDRDGDGINDEEDQCPDVPGVLRYAGCPIPDRDGDGLNDEVDQCPDVPGPISNKGCPLINAEILNKVKLAAENCFFETGKYNLLPASFKTLDEVVKILKADTLLNLNIEGYTDNQGKEKSNQILSENRARAVMNYFIENGISTKRLTSRGYGQTKPVADNSTAIGRAKNRRVEMKINLSVTTSQ